MFVSLLPISGQFTNHGFLNSVHDGWGIAPEEGTEGNAIEAGNTTNMDKITNEYAATTLLASGTAVGLSEGLMGNSEVGWVTPRLIHPLS
jgi:2,3-bisphosphoglycerate-independent phosphoglycerate mutase